MRTLRIASVSLLAAALAVAFAFSDRPASLARASSAAPSRSIAARAGKLSARFGEAGIAARIDERTLALETLGLGREGREARFAPLAPSGDSREARWDRGSGIVEWWRARSTGFEHGFTIAARPDGDGPLRADVRVAGFVPRQRGDVVELAAGRARARYAGLYARDARGRSLPSRFEVRDQMVTLVVDDAHAVYPIEIDPILTTSELRTPSSFQTAGSVQFGAAVGISSTILVVGAPEFDDPSTNAGRAFVFNTGATTAYPLTWTSPRVEKSSFGMTVAVDGESFVVGAPYEHFDPVTYTEEGAAYVFERTGATSWGQTQRLTAGADATNGDNFGWSLAIFGDVIAVGAPGRTTDTGVVYLFQRVSGTWVAQPALSAPDATTNRRFGSAVALGPDVLVVGGWSASNTAEESVYVFDLVGATATYRETLYATGGVIGDYFGGAVSVSGDILAVGAAAYNGQGAVYIFERGTDGSWSYRHTLTEAGTQGFGGSIALSGDLLLVGAPSTADGATNGAGRAFVYHRNPASGLFEKLDTLADGAPASADYFGSSVALAGAVGVIGIPGGDTHFTDAGEAVTYRFQLTTGSPCRPVSAPLCEQGFCVDDVCCGSACDQGCNSCSVATGASADGTCGIRQADLVCRPAADVCDIQELCDGTSAMCPADERMPDCTVVATVPKEDLSCTCQAAGAGSSFGGAAGPLGGLVGLLAAVRTRRRRRR